MQHLAVLAFLSRIGMADHNQCPMQPIVYWNEDEILAEKYQYPAQSRSPNESASQSNSEEGAVHEMASLPGCWCRVLLNIAADHISHEIGCILENVPFASQLMR